MKKPSAGPLAPAIHKQTFDAKLTRPPRRAIDEAILDLEMGNLDEDDVGAIIAEFCQHQRQHGDRAHFQCAAAVDEMCRIRPKRFRPVTTMKPPDSLRGAASWGENRQPSEDVADDHRDS